MTAPLSSSPEIKSLIETFHKIGQAMISAMPLPEALGAILHAIAPLLPGTAASIMLVEREDLIMIATCGLDEDEMRIRLKVGEGIAGWVATHHEPVLCNDPLSDARFVQSPLQRTRIAALLALPLFSLGQVVGVLNLHTADRSFTEPDRDLAELLATLISADIQRHRLEQLAMTDGLTGVGNRYCFDRTLATELARATRYGHSLSLVMFDLDCMKQVNDTFGHPTGDALLRNVGRLVRGLLRTPDCVCRIGGDEFAVLLPDTPADGALIIAERIRAKIDGFNGDGSLKGVHVTGSFGLTGFRKGEAVELFVSRADQALYAAKRAGGNQLTAG
jgi:diguanylate cyclase (GGDEF)-like protein